MKKTLLSALVAVLGFATQAMGQSSTLATLHHNGEIKTFYGTSALSEANMVAEDGDVITLSSGTFFAPTDTITKAITLRGAGMELDTLKGIVPSIIQGNLVFNVSESSSAKLLVESIDIQGNIKYSSLKDPQFLKCRVDTIKQASSNSQIVNSYFLHCIIARQFKLNANSSATLANCYIAEPTSIDSKTSNFDMRNCVIRDDRYSSKSTGIYGGATYYWGTLSLFSSNLTNCIICYRGDSEGSGTSNYFSIYDVPSVDVNNCLAVAYKYDYVRLFLEPIDATTNHSNYTSTNQSAIFKGWNPYNSLKNLKSTRLELTDDAKSKYIGSDGTELGIYGGNLPFNATSTNPRIINCEVDGQTDADGKLNVKIEISDGE